LAPILIDRVYELLARLSEQGVTVIVFEQLATHAIRFASKIVVLEHGGILYEGAAKEQETAEAIRLGYLGHG
jgi:branched-chain amino acid transport system ATP-binding protein